MRRYRRNNILFNHLSRCAADTCAIGARGLDVSCEQFVALGGVGSSASLVLCHTECYVVVIATGLTATWVVDSSLQQRYVWATTFSITEHPSG